MYIAHSALRTKTQNGKTVVNVPHLQQRLQAYQAACQKYQQEIIAIQKYLPGWTPAFEVKR